MRRLFGIALFAAPFLFGLIRLVTTESDWRYLVVALGSTVGAVVVLRRRSAVHSTLQLLIGLACAILFAAGASIVVGARSPLSVAVVAFSFAVCSVTGASLLNRGAGQSNGVE